MGAAFVFTASKTCDSNSSREKRQDYFWFMVSESLRLSQWGRPVSGCMYLTVKTDNDHDAADREAESMMGNQWV